MLPSEIQTLTEYILPEHLPSPYPTLSPNSFRTFIERFTERLPNIYRISPTLCRAQQRRRSALEAAVGGAEAAESNRGMPTHYRVDNRSNGGGGGDVGDGGVEGGGGGGPGRWSRWFRLFEGMRAPDSRTGDQDSAGEG